MTNNELINKLYRIPELEARYDSMIDRMEDVIDGVISYLEQIHDENLIIKDKYNELINYLSGCEIIGNIYENPELLEADDAGL